jgi:nicotinate (nicotinamide) nucleotide adenylyltransferase
MKKTIVVLGGSFNPPTKAHEHILSDAIRQTDSAFGIFVPSSHAYVSRKMKRQRTGNQVYTEAQRYAMLSMICEGKDYLKIDTCEYGDDGRGHTFETLQKIQSKYPDYKILFVIGDDKLSIIPRWHSAKEFFQNFGFVVCCRNQHGQTTGKQFIQQHPVLKNYTNIFQFAEITPEDISSTQARLAIMQHDDTKLFQICSANVAKYLKTIR